MSNPPPGTLVHLRSHSLKASFGSIAVVLSCRGNAATLFTDAGKEDVQRQQFSVPVKPVRDAIPMRLRLPFGYWCLEDGTRILYSRDFCPLWCIDTQGYAQPVLPWWSFETVAEERYWDHRNAPWRNRETELDMESLLQSLGATSDPYLADALFPLMRDSKLSIRAAVLRMGQTAEALS